MTSDTKVLPSTQPLARFLGAIERAGNALPHPATVFAALTVATVFASAIATESNLVVIHPRTGDAVYPVSLLTVAGLHRMLTELVTNFTSYAPLGTALVAVLGMAVAEGSGLVTAALKLVVVSVPRRALTFAVVLAGVMSDIGGELGFVLLIPLAALTFLAVGRHPIAGLAAAFAGVSGGYSANLLLAPVDPILAGLTEEAARIVDASYRVNATANWYFMFVSTFLISILGTIVTERMVEPRLGRFAGGTASESGPPGLSDADRRGLWWAAGAAAVLTALILWGTVPETGVLRDPETGELLRSPFMSGMVALIFVAGLVVGLAFGFGARTITRDTDVVNAMGKAMETMGTYVVLVFFAAQFVAFFNWTNLGLIFAIKGAEALRAAELGTIPLFVSFVAVTATIDLFMVSAAAKWAIMAPVFVPMFMLLGYTPELTQAAYRVGDSVANNISPTMSYLALILAFMQRYQERAGVGTLIATMLPYSVAFFVGWTVLLVIWIVLGLPVGPGAGLSLAPR